MDGVRPATLVDLAEIVARRDAQAGRSTMGADVYAQIVCQLTGGPAWASVSAGRLDAIGGLYFVPDGDPVAWFMAAPSAGQRIAPMMLQARRQMSRWLEALPGGIVVSTREDNRVGRRLAAALGFIVEGRVVFRGARFLIWRLTWERQCNRCSAAAARSAGR